MPLYVNDFKMDTFDLTNGEVGVYMILLMLAWQREDAAIPNDMAWLKRSLKAWIADFHGHTFNAIVPKLLDRYFTLGADNKWRNKRLSNERQKAAKLSSNGFQKKSEMKENNDLAATHSQPHSQSQIVVRDFNGNGLKGKREDGPRNGAISRDRRFVYYRPGADEWASYAGDYEAATGKAPVRDKNGGKWFALLGASVQHVYRGK